MTISITAAACAYTGDGSTTAFDVKSGSNGIYFAASSELVVTVDDVTKTLGTHYTVTGAGTAAGVVTFVTAPADDAAIVITRVTPDTNSVDLSNTGAFDPDVIEGQFDKVARSLQELRAQAIDLPTPEADMLLGWNAEGTALENVNASSVTFTVGTITTGAAGSSASVAVDPASTATNVILNFTIPRGNTGASGNGTGDLLSTNNLSDVADAAAALTSLGAQASLGYTPVNKAGDTMTGALTLSDVAPTLTMYESDGGSDAKRWRFQVNGGVLYGFTTNDVDNATASWIEVTRIGNTISSVNLKGTAIQANGAAVYKAGGADVLLADGGTGASLADPGADRIMFWDDSGSTVEWLALGSGLAITGTTLDATSSITAATQANQEAASSTSVYVSPGRQQYHPSAAKAWIDFSPVGPTIYASYNITSLSTGGAGKFTVTIATDFSSSEYCGVAMAGYPCFASVHGNTAGTFEIYTYDASGTLTDPTTDRIYAVFFGDQ